MKLILERLKRLRELMGITRGDWTNTLDDIIEDIEQGIKDAEVGEVDHE